MACNELVKEALDLLDDKGNIVKEKSK